MQDDTLEKEREKKREKLSEAKVAQKSEGGTSEAHEKRKSHVQGEKNADLEDLNIPLSSFLIVYSRSPKKVVAPEASMKVQKGAKTPPSTPRT